MIAHRRVREPGWKLQEGPLGGLDSSELMKAPLFRASSFMVMDGEHCNLRPSFVRSIVRSSEAVDFVAADVNVVAWSLKVVRNAFPQR